MIRQMLRFLHTVVVAGVVPAVAARHGSAALWWVRLPVGQQLGCALPGIRIWTLIFQTIIFLFII